VLGVADVNPEAPLYIYDLASISERERENLLPAELMPQRDIEPIDRTYDVDSVLPFLFPAPNTIGPEFAQAVGYPDIDDSVAATLRDAWREAVGDHPGDYLASRWTLFMRQIGVTRNGLSVYPPEPAQDGRWDFRFPGVNGLAMDYAEAFTEPEESFYGQAMGNFLFTPWPYLLVCLVGAIVFLRRGRDRATIVVGALALAALTHQIGLFFVALGTRWRFEYPSVVVGMLVGALLLLYLAQRSPTIRNWRPSSRQASGIRR
jgi:hypothetical protein